MADQEAIGPRALYYEQFQVGARWCSPFRTLTETDSLMFAALSGDATSLCFDATAPENAGGRRINAACTMAIATGLEQRLGLKEGTGIAFLGASWVCHRPVYASDTVRVEQCVEGVRTTKNDERGLVTFDVRLVSHREEILCSGRWTLLIRRNLSLPLQAGTDVVRPETAVDAALSSVAGSKACLAGFKVGDRWTTPRRTLSETDIAQFCALTGDYNPAHSDAEFARASTFGQRILQGPAGLAIGIGLQSRLGVEHGGNLQTLAVNWTFKEPIFAGDTISCSLTVKEVIQSHTMLLDAVVVNQHGRAVQLGEWTMMAP